MFFNKKKDNLEQEPAVVEVPQVQEPAPEPEELLLPEEKKPSVFTPAETTVIGKGLVFHGNFSGEDPIIVNGSIQGDITTTSKLTVSTGGSYYGNANVADLETNGTIEGNLVCDNFSLMCEESVMNGTLSTKYMETKHGSVFTGSLTMTGTGNAPAKPMEPVPSAPVLEEPIKVPDFLDVEENQ